MSHRVDPRVALRQIFSNISQSETMVNLSDRVSQANADGCSKIHMVSSGLVKVRVLEIQ